MLFQMSLMTRYENNSLLQADEMFELYKSITKQHLEDIQNSLADASELTTMKITHECFDAADPVYSEEIKPD